MPDRRLPTLVLLGIAWCGAARAAQDLALSAPVEERIRRIESNLKPVSGKAKAEGPKTIAERMKTLGVPGVSVAVIDGGEIVWTRAYGVKELGKDDPVTPETLFQAASISKPVSALAALRLAERGALDLDADINSVLKGWKVPDAPEVTDAKVTLRHVLSHTAGFGDGFGFPGYEPGVERPTLVQILDGRPPANTAPRAVRVKHPPGEAFRYSGGGYCLVQMLIEEQTGQPFADYMKAEILTPVGMSRSTFEQPLPEDRAGEAASAHYSGMQLLAKGLPVVKGRWHVYPEQAAAGLWTTPTDLAKFAIAIQKADDEAPGALLGGEIADAMLTPQSGGYGLGLGLQREGDSSWFSHGGGNEGFICMVIGSRGTGQGAAVMTNSSNGGVIVEELLRSIGEEYGWKIGE